MAIYSQREFVAEVRLAYRLHRLSPRTAREEYEYLFSCLRFLRMAQMCPEVVIGGHTVHNLGPGQRAWIHDLLRGAKEYEQERTGPAAADSHAGVGPLLHP